MSKKLKAFFKWVKIILIIAIVSYLSYYIVIKSGFFNIKQISVVNNDFLNPKDIIKETGIKGDDNFFLVNLYGPREKLLTNPYIKDVEIRRVFPDKINIVVYERKEFCYVDVAGTIVVVDEQGRVLRTVESTEALILLEGFEIENYRIGEIMTSVDPYEFQRALDIVDLSSQIEGIDVKTIDYRDEFLMMNMKNGLKVDFGNGNDIESKFNKFYAIYEDLSKKGIKEGLINVNNNGIPTYRPF